MSDLFLFAVFPYLAVALAIGGGIYRATRLRDTLTARSSQLLESRLQGAGARPWHWAILLVLGAHLLSALFPKSWAVLLASPARLYALEVVGLALGLLALAGLSALIVRRLSLTHASAPFDWVVLALLFVQVATGVGTAISLRWGSSWYLYTAVPWFHALARLDPQVSSVLLLPGLAKLHLLNAFLIIALLPLTRLAHMFTLPLGYLWRSPQLVSWRHAKAP